MLSSRERALVLTVAVLAVVSVVLTAFTILQSQRGIRIESIEQDSSSYRNDPSFEGGCMVIRDQPTWEAFWGLHVAERDSPPPVPHVDFSRDMALACFLGWQPNAGDFIRVDEVLPRNKGGYWVFVEQFIAEGQVIRIPINPSDIVLVPRTDGPTFFFDVDTGESLPLLEL